MGRKGLFSKRAKGSGQYAANGPGIYLEMDLEDYEIGMWSESKFGEERHLLIWAQRPVIQDFMSWPGHLGVILT